MDRYLKTTFILVIVIFFTLFVGSVISSQDVDTELKELIKVLESGDSFSSSYSAELKLENHLSNGEIFNIKFKMYSKGFVNTILYYLEPDREKGKIILYMKKDGENKYWMYFPKTKSTIIIPASGLLAGEMSNGDIAKPPVLELYDYKIVDKTKTEGKTTFKVEFTAKNKTALYGKMIYEYIDNKTIHSELYTRKGILIKEAFYSNHTKSPNGVYIAQTIKVVNAIEDKKYTIINFSDFENVDIPDSWFNPNNLEKVRP